MKEHEPNDELEFVPEVEASALRDVSLPPSMPPPPPEPPIDAAAMLPTDPAAALEALPPVLAAHIRDLIAEAEAEGYLRGRNEQIEAVQHFDVSDDDDCEPTPSLLPRYNHRSIWDL